jgi:HNH endonuclease
MGALKHIRQRKMIAQGGRCYYCGLPMWDDAVPTDLRGSDTIRSAPKVLRCTAEHLLARSDGGGDTTDNIVAACLYCNTQRHRRKRPLSPDKHRIHVRARMEAGRWLAALNSGQLSHKLDGPT